MRKLLSIVIVLFAVGAVLGSGARRPAPQDPPAAAPQRDASDAQPAERRKIDWKADFAGPVTPGDSVIFLVGNFAAQHNGALIACDSAVQHSERHWEFFGNVLINKNTTYIYGDRATYDGDLNEARVYSELIKVVDGDATLYTFTFVYNTQTNVGEFDGGGYLINGENLLESQRGYYFGDDKLVASVDEVQMRNEEYALKGDSVLYNLETDDAFFFEHTNIWRHNGDYLYADRGSYRSVDTIYYVTRNGYLLTEKQELWSDSIDYFRPQEHIILRHDLQIDDTEHKTLSFGDYGEYWKEPGNAFLTRQPAVISYDTEQSDSLFMRSDSIYLFTLNRLAEARTARLQATAEAESEARRQAEAAAAAASEEAPDPEPGDIGTVEATVEEAAAEETQQAMPQEEAPALRETAEAAGTAVQEAPQTAAPTPRTDADPSAAEAPAPARRSQTDLSADETPAPAASAPSEPAETSEVPETSAVDETEVPPAETATEAADTTRVINPLDTMTQAERKAYLNAQKRKAQAVRKAAAQKAKKIKLDSIAARRRIKINRRLDAQKAREEQRAEARRQKAILRLNAARARAARKGKTFGKADPEVVAKLDSMSAVLNREFDSLSVVLDTLLARQLRARQVADSVVLPEPDSIYRLIKGFRNVRIYRSDFQVVCDSMTSLSTDSTIHLHIDPVLWNENNQITSDSVTAYTANQELVRAEFFGSPIMSSEHDTIYYDQIKGKTMTAYFRDNQIYRNDVVGNAQTIYYMTDGEPPVVTTMGIIESGDLSFYFEEKQLVQMIWRANPEYNFYPIIPEFLVPESQSLYLDGFHWEAARRPSQQDVFDRRIRPSEREARLSLEPPTFPIMQRIDAFKQRLIERRQWVDRNDPVDQATVEWMHDLGYEVGEPHPDYRRPARPAASGSAAAPTQPQIDAETPAPAVPADSLPAEQPAVTAPPAEAVVDEPADEPAEEPQPDPTE